MKKSFFTTSFWVLTMVLFSNCVSTPKSSEEEKPTLILQEMLDSFIAQNENLTNNEITMKDGAISLMHLVQESIGDTLHFVSELPMEFEMALEYNQSPFSSPSSAFPYEGKFVVKFNYSSSRNPMSDNYSTTFQVFSIVEKDVVLELVKGKFYHINCTFKDFANTNGSFLLPSGKAFNGFPSITLYDSKPKFNFGTLVVENLTFTPVQ